MATTLTALESKVRDNLNQPAAPSSGLWSSAQIQQKIVNRIRRMNRYFKTGIIDDSTATSSDDYQYNFPSGVVSIDKIELWDTYSNPNVPFGELVNWKTMNNDGVMQIIFPQLLPYNSVNPAAYTLRIYGKKRINESNPNMQPEEEELAVLGATMDCLRDLLRSQIDMTKYLASAVKGQGTAADVVMAIREYRQEYNDLFNQLKTSKTQKLSFGM